MKDNHPSTLYCSFQRPGRFNIVQIFEDQKIKAETLARDLRDVEVSIWFIRNPCREGKTRKLGKWKIEAVEIV